MLLPVDFSAHSNNAVNYAVDLAIQKATASTFITIIPLLRLYLRKKLIPLESEAPYLKLMSLLKIFQSR
ncbi:hypothetical protein [Sphingobacterium sp. E70]|uniref:hypothetical protein n=1 Tax=Sphingobacterium sp. E70 TaxID=2853439 RepID=UPI00359C84AE